MIDLSDFDFKKHLSVFRVIVDDVAIADVPLGSLEHFLLCLLHANRTARIRVTFVRVDCFEGYDSGSCK